MAALLDQHNAWHHRAGREDIDFRKRPQARLRVHAIGIRHSDTLEELVRCAGSWEAEARLLGNLRAADIVAAVSEALRITRKLGGYSYSVWDDEDFRDGYRKVNSGLIVDASKFHGGRDGGRMGAVQGIQPAMLRFGANELNPDNVQG